jgi:hypothetical protein
VGARAPGRVVGRAGRFLLSQENDDGGFPSQPGANSNAQSTAFAVQGLIAVGAARHNVARAQAYLRSLIAPDGHVAYARGQTQTPVWVTAQAEAALVGRPLPLPSPSPAAVAVPVARRPPGRRARAHAMGHGAIAHTASRRRGVRKLRTRRKAAAPPLNPLVRGVGIAAALALAPVENP